MSENVGASNSRNPKSLHGLLTGITLLRTMQPLEGGNNHLVLNITVSIAVKELLPSTAMKCRQNLNKGKYDLVRENLSTAADMSTVLFNVICY
jgi:hypothetical protein